MTDEKVPGVVPPSSHALTAATSTMRRAALHFKRHGAKETIKKTVIYLLQLRGTARYHAAGRLFDEKNNVRTSGQVLLSEINVDGGSTAQSMWYEPAPVNVVPDICGALERSYQDFTFVDLGSGRGRVALQASHFDFKKVVGVEFARDLHEQALENLKNYPKGDQACRDVEFLCTDVRDYEFPDTGMVIFIFDSFKEELLRLVINKLKESYDLRPRKIYLVYLNPDERNRPIPTIEGAGFLFKKDVFNFLKFAKYSRGSPYSVVVYETRG